MVDGGADAVGSFWGASTIARFTGGQRVAVRTMQSSPHAMFAARRHCRSKQQPKGFTAMHRLALCLVIASLILATPRHAAAAVTDFYEAIDFVEINKRDPTLSGSPASLMVRGILVGGTPVTRTYAFVSTAGVPTEGLETAMHCHRLAVLAMSKPGKFQFAIGPGTSASILGGCRLTLAAP
jgi:hypothetical protein